MKRGSWKRDSAVDGLIRSERAVLRYLRHHRQGTTADIVEATPFSYWQIRRAAQAMLAQGRIDFDFCDSNKHGPKPYLWIYKRPDNSGHKENRCECGNPGMHFVRLSYLSGDDKERSDWFWLCDDCYALEFEPVQTKGEAVWNR